MTEGRVVHIPSIQQFKSNTNDGICFLIGEKDIVGKAVNAGYQLFPRNVFRKFLSQGTV